MPLSLVISKLAIFGSLSEAQMKPSTKPVRVSPSVNIMATFLPEKSINFLEFHQAPSPLVLAQCEHLYLNNE